MDFLICQTVAASPAEPGELPFWFSYDCGSGGGTTILKVKRTLVFNRNSTAVNYDTSVR